MKHIKYTRDELITPRNRHQHLGDIMTTTWALPTLAIAAALTLTACGGSEPAQTATETKTETSTSTVTETSTSTVTQTASGIDYTDSDQYHEETTEEPAPTTTEAPEPTGDSDIAAAALELTWNDMTYTEQEDICFGWNLMPTESLDVFMENSDGFITREQAKTFFDTKCEDF